MSLLQFYELKHSITLESSRPSFMLTLYVQLSEMLKKSLAVGTTVLALSSAVGSVETKVKAGDPSPEVQFHSLQYALFTTNFVEVLGGLFFLFTALYIQQDKEIAERELAGNCLHLCH